MSGSWRIGRLFGIGVYIHWTFLILIAWIVGSRLLSGQSLGAALYTLLFVGAIFFCVVLHECGHALAARRFGVRTRDITLLPIGGVARLERMPEKPAQELVVAIAGPLVNVLIALALAGLLLVQHELKSLPGLDLIRGGFMAQLLAVNVVLVVFNLIPAFPMDGGRVLRALLATSMDHARATRIAADVGKLIAIVFGLIGLFFDPLLLFVALFVFLGAQAESQRAEMRWTMRGAPVRDAMLTRFETLSPTDAIQSAADAMRRSGQAEIVVERQGRAVGVIDRHQVIHALRDANHAQPVEAFMSPAPQTIHMDAPLDAAAEALQAEQCRALLVVDGERVVGVITPESIGQWLMLHSASARQRPAQPTQSDAAPPDPPGQGPIRG